MFLKQGSLSMKGTLTGVCAVPWRGDTDAQCALGLLYIAQNTPESVALGIMWMTRAAEQGNSTAMFWLGLMYEYGRLVPKDETKAARLILQSALLGNAAAIQYIECGGKIMRGLPISLRKTT